jgi:ABC-2 type transport system permease protein
MMIYFRLLRAFIRSSAQEETAFRANFVISLFQSMLNLAVGILGIMVLFSQVQSLQGWDLPATLALLGIYLIVSALRGLVFGPSLENLAGMGQDIATGNFDFTLLRPVSPQFLSSFRRWRLFSLLDLALGVGVVIFAVSRPGQSITLSQLLIFFFTLGSGVAIVYAFLLGFTALVFWSPGLLFTWVFDGIFQMARYPVGIYPGWLRFILTWIIPLGMITTFPAQALTGVLPFRLILGAAILAAVLVLAASRLFHIALRRYSSASS